MHDCTEELVVGQKAAQMGFTEWALNIAFYHIDVRGESVLYILPASTPDASDFSSGRFDPALELSPHLQNLFSNVKNVGHKRAGSASLYIRGSRSKSQLRSIPAPIIIFDEVDVMDQANIVLAFERSSGQLEHQHLMLSTPTIANKGINKYYKDSSQDHYMFRCPLCSKLTELIFPDCLEITAEEVSDPKIRKSFIKCKDCGGRLEHEAKTSFLSKGQWVSKHTDRLSRGFHVNQLYSTTVRPYELASLYLASSTNPAAEQEFYNSKLGIPHEVAGARVTDAQFEKCISTHKKQDVSPPDSLITMGVDVGTWLHYEITQYITNRKGVDIHDMSRARVITEGKVLNFEELDGLMRQYRVRFCVVDANPEKRKAIEFAKRFYGHVRLCFYGNSSNGKQIHVHDEDQHTITVDRTSWMDVALGRYRENQIALPMDVSLEYRDHIKAPVRVYRIDSTGNPVASYDSSDDDHFGHARTYNEIALSLAASISRTQNITTGI